MGDAARRMLWPVLLAAVVSASFSIRWIHPLLTPGTDGFMPVEYTGSRPSDDYYYYSVVREMLDGSILSGDPVTLEHKSDAAMFGSYRASLIMCSIGGFLSGGIEGAYYFNYLVYPALNFLLMYALAHMLTGRRLLSASVAVVLVYFYPALFRLGNIPLTVIASALGRGDMLESTQLARTPNLLFTNIHLFASAIMLLRTHKTRCAEMTSMAGLALLLGVSSYVSVQNFIVCHALAGGVLAAHARQREFIRRALLVAAFSIAMNAPGIAGIFQTREIIESVLDYVSGAPHFINTKFYAHYFVYFLAEMLPVTLLLSVLSFEGKAYVMSVLWSFIAVYAGISTMGTHPANEIYVRGAQPLFVLVASCGILSVLSGIVSERAVVIDIPLQGRRRISVPLGHGTSRFISAAYAPVLAGIVALVLAAALLNQTALAKSHESRSHGRDFRELSSWLSANSNDRESVLTMDFDLMIHLPLYSPVNVYVPQAMLSPASHDERFGRFFEAAAFYGLSAGDFRVLLDNMRSHNDMPGISGFSETRMALMQLVLFYGRYAIVPMTEAEKDEMTARYAERLSEGKGLSYQADYLVVSEFDRAVMNQGSRALAAASGPAIFGNRSYSVYALGGN